MEVTHEQLSEECSICLEVLSTPVGKKGLLGTPCKHLFHRHCIMDWLNNGKPGDCCPLCMRKIMETEVTHVMPMLENRITRKRRSISSTTAVPTKRSANERASGEPVSSSGSSRGIPAAPTNQLPPTPRMPVPSNPQPANQNSWTNAWNGFWNWFNKN